MRAKRPPAVPAYIQEQANLRKLAAARAESAAASSGRLSYGTYKKLFWKNYVAKPYQIAIDAVLMQVAEYVLSKGKRGRGRVMIFAPPRHGKTKNVSQMFPGWLLGQNPDLRLLNTGYGADLAKRNSRAVRNTIASAKYQRYYPHVRLSKDSAAAELWDLEGRDGGMLAAGISSGIGGHGANLITIDDIVKSRHEAESTTYRSNAEDWYQNELITRLEEPGGAIIVMLTRWHQHDLAGFILENEKDDWLVLSLPALAGPEDVLGRAEGEALFPEKMSRAMLLKRREVMGAYNFDALYQQDPQPAGARLFDMLKVEELDMTPETKQDTRFWDLAITENAWSDYTVGTRMGVMTEERYFVHDVVRAQREYPDVKKMIKQTALRDGKAVKIILEGEKAGIIILQELLKDPELRGYQIKTVAPEMDKYSRALPFAARVDAERVFCAKGKWVRDWKDELSVFPLGEHDDQVDSSSGAYNELAKPRGVIFG